MKFSRGSLVTSGSKPFFLLTLHIDEWRLARMSGPAWVWWVAVGPVRVGWARK